MASQYRVIVPRMTPYETWMMVHPITEVSPDDEDAFYELTWAFRCAKCRQIFHESFGCADELYDHCDRCWDEVTNG